MLNSNHGIANNFRGNPSKCTHIGLWSTKQAARKTDCVINSQLFLIYFKTPNNIRCIINLITDALNAL